MNKSRILTLAIMASMSSGLCAEPFGAPSFFVPPSSAPASVIYGVHDGGLNDSQFCYIPVPFPNGVPAVIPFGPSYDDCDIEALDIQYSTEAVDTRDKLYAASGDNTPRPGHLYQVTPFVGTLSDLGNVKARTGEPLKEIDAISFHPYSGDLWGWAQDDGLFVIRAEDIPSEGVEITPPCEKEPRVRNILADLVIPKAMEVEAITWNWDGTMLYGVENCHDDPHPHDVDSHGGDESNWPYNNPRSYDFDCGIRLWAGDVNQGDDDLDSATWTQVCPDISQSIKARLAQLYPRIQNPVAEIEALESVVVDGEEAFCFGEPPLKDADDMVLMGFHGPHHLLYALITIPSCEITWLDDVDSESLSDIEGLACGTQPPPILLP